MAGWLGPLGLAVVLKAGGWEPSHHEAHDGWQGIYGDSHYNVVLSS